MKPESISTELTETTDLGAKQLSEL